MTGVENDIDEAVRTLLRYKEKGRVLRSSDAKDEPIISLPVDKKKFRQLTQEDDFDKTFLAIDCSTVPLKRAANWGSIFIVPLMPWCTLEVQVRNL